MVPMMRSINQPARVVVFQAAEVAEQAAVALSRAIGRIEAEIDALEELDAVTPEDIDAKLAERSALHGLMLAIRGQI